MYVCICNAVTEGEVKQAIAAGAESAEALQETLGVATCCGSCRDAVDHCLNTSVADAPAGQVGGVKAIPGLVAVPA